MLVFWVLVLGGIVWVATVWSPDARGPSDGARQLLDERFARGELDVDEYRRRRDALGR